MSYVDDICSVRCLAWHASLFCTWGSVISRKDNQKSPMSVSASLYTLFTKSSMSSSSAGGGLVWVLFGYCLSDSEAILSYPGMSWRLTFTSRRASTLPDLCQVRTCSFQLGRDIPLCNFSRRLLIRLFFIAFWLHKHSVCLMIGLHLFNGDTRPSGHIRRPNSRCLAWHWIDLEVVVVHNQNGRLPICNLWWARCWCFNTNQSPVFIDKQCICITDTGTTLVQSFNQMSYHGQCTRVNNSTGAASRDIVCDHRS